MGWFAIFKRREHKRKARKSNRSPSVRSLVEKLRSDTSSLHLQLQAIQTTVDKHGVSLNEHATLFEEHKVRVAKLEQLVAQPATSVPIESPRQISRAQASVEALLPRQKYDVNNFSPQEKRILQLFFEHPDMALSYTDLSQALGKSPLTVKNQLHEIRLKADLLTKTIDADNRNRFKLRDGIRLQKYLNLG
jgi:DNA-binding CsgD family transcriptional regulator